MNDFPIALTEEPQLLIKQKLG